MNKKIKSLILNYQDNLINSLDIYFGKLQNNILFEKNLDKNLFNAIYKTMQIKNYKYNKYDIIQYNYNNDYLTINTKKYISKKNIQTFHINDSLFAIYLKEDKPYSDFSNKKNYNKLTKSIEEFSINNEIKILFINNNQIKLEITLNHNIDNTIPILDDLLNSLLTVSI